MAFTPFKAATKAKAPNYLAAYVADEKMKQQQEMQANALRSQNMLGGGMLYNQAMGKASPIADQFSKWFGDGVTGGDIIPQSQANATADVAANASVTAPTTAGEASWLSMTNPYTAAATMFAADQTMNDGRITKDLTDPDKYVDALAATFGKGWAWS